MIRDIVLHRGATFSETMVVVNASGSIVDLSGSTAVMQVRKSHESDDVLLELTTPTEITLAGSGALTLTASAVDTADMPAGLWVYDVLVTKTATGVKTRVVEGSIRVTPGVTR